jgi:predicted nucleotidyltransferase
MIVPSDAANTSSSKHQMVLLSGDPRKRNESSATGYVTTSSYSWIRKKPCSSRLDHTTTILPSYLLEVASRKSKSLARSEAKIREYIQI